MFLERRCQRNFSRLPYATTMMTANKRRGLYYVICFYVQGLEGLSEQSGMWGLQGEGGAAAYTSTGELHKSHGLKASCMFAIKNSNLWAHIVCAVAV